LCAEIGGGLFCIARIGPHLFTVGEQSLVEQAGLVIFHTDYLPSFVKLILSLEGL
jgi:hypothetical protein